jgi:PHP family Zn ribbon phosphoesterase
MMEDGSLITPLWLLVDGTVEVTKTEDGKPYLEVNAVNSYGVEVHIVYDGTMTAVSDVQSPVSNTRKIMENGQLLIIRNGETYNAIGNRL